jgi:hypothetical protein
MLKGNMIQLQEYIFIVSFFGLYMMEKLIHPLLIQQDATVYKKFYFIFIWSLTCFGWHTAHHQEPKTALAASGFV